MSAAISCASPCSPVPTGVLLVNLGTPDAPQAASIRRYLHEFLSDRYVVDLPAWLWQPVLRGIVLPLRTRKLVERYRQVWMNSVGDNEPDSGAPLRVWSRAQARAVGCCLHETDARLHTALSMRYGRPSMADALQTLQDKGCRRILTVPMYPQYSRSTTATVVDALTEQAARLARQHPAGLRPLELGFIEHFHDAPEYIDAVAAQLTRHWAQHGRAQRTLLSFHSLPVKMIRRGDPYHAQCLQTAALLRQRLELPDEALHISFQSRFGRQQWLQPCTKDTLQGWARQGIKTVEVLCPGFVADCLETLEEIQLRGRAAFLDGGGQTLHYLPCLNDDAQWARGFAALIARHVRDWA